MSDVIKMTKHLDGKDDMKSQALIRVEKDNFSHVALRYSIYGLNLFDCAEFSEVKHFYQAPFIRFILHVSSYYEMVGLIGYPSLQEWFDDRYYHNHHIMITGQHEEISPRLLFGKNIRTTNIPICFHEGSFWENSQRGESLLFMASTFDDEMLFKPISLFLGYDAVAFFLYATGRNAFCTTQNILNRYYEHPRQVLEGVTQEAGIFLRSQNEGQYLQIITPIDSPGIEEHIQKACDHTAEYIASTSWFQQHDKQLFWDETAHSYRMSMT
ncbi:hypothetical protein U14_05526 [Candidatus Moduliflexus flocculans]|uniref:Uncharacterized protein n=1 Tax=Candidatus Moduliflexus flocculans TaxID=1499966 RepID=A0A081BS66_9BACT|nr:hypothetical protein U14_05526 [Candidatus Moduliflexus flocculans]